MEEYALFRAVYVYDRSSNLTRTKFFFAPPGEEEQEYGCEPATVPAALTELRKERWKPMTTVGFSEQVTGGYGSYSAPLSQLIYTLVRDLPKEPTSQL